MDKNPTHSGDKQYSEGGTLLAALRKLIDTGEVARIKSTPFKVFVTMAVKYRNKRGLAWPGLTELARHVGLQRSQVKAALRELRDDGLLKLEKRGGPGRASVFRINLEQGRETGPVGAHREGRPATNRAGKPAENEAGVASQQGRKTGPAEDNRAGKPAANMAGFSSQQGRKTGHQQPMNSPRTAAAPRSVPGRVLLLRLIRVWGRTAVRIRRSSPPWSKEASEDGSKPSWHRRGPASAGRSSRSAR